MRTVPLGNTDVQVSVFCLGTMYLGSREDQATSYRLLDQYVEAGGSFLDTANTYARWLPGCSGGESEALLGKWMRERRNRSRMSVATKVGFGYPGVERGLRARQIETECEKSLRRLGTATVDLYQAHVDDRNTPMEETMEAFDRLVLAGKVRFVGASNFAVWRLEEARWVSQTHGWMQYCSIQQHYSYLRPRPGASFAPQVAANADLLDYCRARRLTLLAYSPLLGGAYTRTDRSFPAQYQGPDSDARLAVLNIIAREVGATPNQVVLAWIARMGTSVQSAPAVIPLVAASTTKQLQENLAALELTLSPDQVARLHDATA
jgi:aryl-alcohol dehydrogenase-like predicted oxidoreductase